MVNYDRAGVRNPIWLNVGRNTDVDAIGITYIRVEIEYATIRLRVGQVYIWICGSRVFVYRYE